MKENQENEMTIEEPTLDLGLEEKQEDINYHKIIEGLLFVVGDEGLTIDQILSVIDCPKNVLINILDDMMSKYDNEDRGIELVNYGSKYKLVSKNDIYPYVEKLFKNNKITTLSQSALETLAIIAYKQPITRVEIEEIRGVGSDMMLKKLMARDLIREKGRSEAPGRPILYEVTDEFMDSFKLLSLDELPELPDYESNDGNELFEE